MKTKLGLLLGLLAVSACGPQVGAADIAAALPTVAAARTQAAIETGVAGQLAPSATRPAATATASLEPGAVAATALFTLTGPHGNGAYQVGVSIAPGVWRAIPQREGYCYWARRKYDGILLGEYYGPQGIEMRVRETDFEVEFDGCGVFVYMGQ